MNDEFNNDQIEDFSRWQRFGKSCLLLLAGSLAALAFAIFK